jgi:cellulose synthase/poly-beta-1,6-N-acetylglucosamine synthase-like glycosyltransferase
MSTDLMLQTVFWLSVAAVGYTYAGYPLLLAGLASLHQLRSDWRFASGGGGRRRPAAQAAPTVAVLVAAYNEERHIAERVRNLLASNYPADRLRIYIGSDASSDRTLAELAAFDGPRIRVCAFTARRGKPSVINDLAAMAAEDILVFTDANTAFEPQTIAQLVRHFDEPGVGCVCGELRLVTAGGDNQDHVYWRYERMLKFLEGRIGALLGANGGVYALRREMYRPVPANAIVDDFWISMNLVRDGYHCVYDPEAVATEEVPERMGDEFRRRVRIGIGNYQALRQFAGLLDPRRGAVALAFFSHKCLRWLVPHFLVLAFAANALLAAQPLYAALLAMQVSFYLAAGYAFLQSRRGQAPRALRIPLFLVGMNLALLVGCWRYLSGQYSGSWTRTQR